MSQDIIFSRLFGSRGVFGMGKGNTIEYVTIDTLGNVTDFGDLTEARSGLSGASNGAS